MVTVTNTPHHPADRAPTLHSTHDAVSAALSQTPTPYLSFRLPWYKQTSYCITLPNKRRQNPFQNQNLVTYCFHRWYVQIKAAFGKAAGNAGQAGQPTYHQGKPPNAISIHKVFSSRGQTHSGTGTLLKAAQNSTLFAWPCKILYLLSQY